MPVSTNVQDFHAKSSDLNSKVSLIEKQYAGINFNYYTKINPNLSAEEVTNKVATERLEVLKKLFVLFPTLQADTNLTPELMLKDVNQASSKITRHCQNTVRNIALTESGIVGGVGGQEIDIQAFISEVQIAIPTGKKKREYIVVADEDDPTEMITTPDYLEVDEYTYETVTVIKDKASFENTINNIVNQAVLKSTEQVDSQLENFNQLIEQTQINNQNASSEVLNRDAIRFEAAKLIREMTSGADVRVDNGGESITLNWMNANKELNAKNHYLELVQDLQNALLEANGIKYVEEDKIVQKRVAQTDGSFLTKDIVTKVSMYKPDPHTVSGFGRTLFSTIKAELADGTQEDRNLFNIWLSNLHSELGKDMRDFLTNSNNLTLSKENDSKMYDLFIGSMDKTNIETPRTTGGRSGNDDWEPNVPVNIFITEPKKAGLFDEVNNILNTSATKNTEFLMSNYNNNHQQQVPTPLPVNNQQNQQLPNGQNQQMSNQSAPVDVEVVKSLNDLQQILGGFSSL